MAAACCRPPRVAASRAAQSGGKPPHSARAGRQACCSCRARRRCSITTAEKDTAERLLTTEELVRLFSVLSHDLKSPIFAVDGFSDLLLSDYLDKLDEEGQDFLRRIRSSAQYMKRVLDDMSHMVKLLARPTIPRPTPMRELFEEVILKHNYAIEEGGVRVEMPEDLPTLDVDPEKIREAVGAILANALFFTDREKGDRRITVDASRDGGMQRICIRDNGIGIDPRYSSQIFELGGMSKLDKPRGGGPGYGLYLARRVIETHGGTLSVESTPGEGTTLCFTIPA
ncbi:MAG TPA: ATP-binding protein [Thermoanaerobaculia bacterium]|nr:ATP-binding protein [Thermoanaerobaculia bacterium]